MELANPAADYWLRRAKRLALFVNAVWLMERLVPVVVAVNLVACCLVLILQRHISKIELVLYVSASVCALVALVLGIVRAKQPFRAYDALLRLETALKLDSRLTTAYSDFIDWPPPKPQDAELKWFYQVNWQRPFFAVAASFVILLGSFMIPFSVEQSSPLAENPSPPLEISKVEAWIEQLEEAGFIDEEALEDLKQLVADLKNRPSDEWFTAGALEAADHLYESTSNSIEGLAQNMQLVSSVLSGASTFPESLNDEIYEQIEQAYQEALSNMQNGSLQLSPELMNQLGQMDLSKLSQMDPNALKELQDRSEEWAKACQQLGGMSEAEKQQLASYYESLMNCEGGMRKPAPGEIQRGRGDADMGYSNYRSPDEAAKEEAVSNDDLRNAAISDTIRTTISNQQEKAAEFAGPVAGGALDSMGAGGEAVWVDRLTPAERKLLREHFK